MQDRNSDMHLLFSQLSDKNKTILLQIAKSIKDAQEMVEKPKRPPERSA